MLRLLLGLGAGLGVASAAHAATQSARVDDAIYSTFINVCLGPEEKAAEPIISAEGWTVTPDPKLGRAMDKDAKASAWRKHVDDGDLTLVLIYPHGPYRYQRTCEINAYQPTAVLNKIANTLEAAHFDPCLKHDVTGPVTSVICFRKETIDRRYWSIVGGEVVKDRWPDKSSDGRVPDVVIGVSRRSFK